LFSTKLSFLVTQCVSSFVAQIDTIEVPEKTKAKE